MGYKAEFKNASERKLVNMAWELSGLSQGAFTRVVLLREALRLAEMAQVKSADSAAVPHEEVTTNAEKNPNAAVSGEAAGEGSGSNLVADAPPADGAPRGA